ncbi:glycosyltransferase, partial [Candidatus Uhrbacteria bacterium]|nr:glycosyltransferase [Candidatus Uhrbacteria bacterium]
VDDGSQDDPLSVVEPYMRQDKRVRMIKQDNGGVASARNTGIASTDAKYICPLDADDEIMPNFVSQLVPHLEADRSLGLVFSSLTLITKDREGKGNWPNGYDYDKQLRGLNQVPTCCLFRREAWESLAGYRQRYAPGGCGTEDAEFWLRMGAYGYGGKHAVKEPLFRYHLGGRSTKRPEEVEWLGWHPWTADGQHPFASQATPEFHSHPVRSYENPLVSVIIPVSPHHTEHVIEALDSLDAQVFRDWEAIVVWDGIQNERVVKAFPHVKYIQADRVGTGAARNLGAQHAAAPFLLFLDADDCLLPNGLQIMFEAYADLKEPAIVYTESLGVRSVDDATAQEYKMHNELVSYYDGIATIYQKTGDYEYETAIMQPGTKQPYFWCYITSLIPKAWHESVGGFDEELTTWEDWDYWIRIAKAGYNFVAVHEACMVYNYDTGTRRESGKAVKDEMVDLLRQKHKEVPIVACHSCGKAKSNFSQRPSPESQERSTMPQQIADSNFKMCTYTNPRRGSHGVVGAATFDRQYIDNMVRTGEGWRINYGYHSQGDQFLVHLADINANPGWFTPIPPPVAQKVVRLPQHAPPVKPKGPTEVKPLEIEEKPTEAELLEVEEKPTEETFDFQTLPSVTEEISLALNELGADSLESLLVLGEAIKGVKGIGEVKAEAILTAAREKLGDDAPIPEDALQELE